MQQWFQCPSCGAPVAFGMRFCGNCGTQLNWPTQQQPQPSLQYQNQQYQCANCGAPLAFGMRFCGNCGTQLNWPTQQQTQPPPVYQQSQQPEKEPKKTSSLLISCLGLMVGIALLAGGGIFAANSDLWRTPSTTPPALTETPPSEPAGEDQESDYETPPEYIQQFENKQPPVIGSYGNTPYLSNDSGATDVSFAELKSFIREDTTDEGLYLLGERDCVDFAEQVHNNAERAGIKAAFVAVNFAGEEIGHTLNAFKTTDRGLVYIDCTGSGFKSVTYLQDLSEKASCPCERDKVAYVEAGKEFGGISIDKAESPQYGFYVEYTQNWQKYDGIMNDYNSEVAAFNQALGGRTTLAEPEYSEFKAWEAELTEKERILDGLAEKLANCWFEPLGIVEIVRIYW